MQRLDGVAQQLRHKGQQQRTKQYTADIAHATQHHHGQHHHRLVQHKAARADEALHRGIQATGDAAKAGTDGKGQQLDAGGVDAHGARRDFVFTDRLPGAADARLLQAADQHDRQ